MPSGNRERCGNIGSGCKVTNAKVVKKINITGTTINYGTYYVCKDCFKWAKSKDYYTIKIYEDYLKPLTVRESLMF